MKFRAALLIAAAWLVCAAATAQVSFPGAPGSPQGGIQPPQITLEILVEEPVNDEVHGLVRVGIPETWHINSATPKDQFSIPTRLQVTSPALKISRIDYPPHVERALGFAGGAKVAVYEGKVDMPFLATRLSPDGEITATLFYQACNDSVCLPPKEISTTAQLSKVITKALPPAGSSSSGFVPLSQAPSAGEGGVSSLLKGDVGKTFESHGLALSLFVIFLAGLVLNLTPCVYPLIPLTVAFFSSQTEGKRGRRTMLAVLYVLGIAVTYSALGVFAALSGKLFGAWLQSPVVLIFFAVMMLLLSASMFGAYDIQVPHFISDRAGSRGGYVGSLTMGLLAGIVAAPCVGPFVISLIAFVAQKANPYLGFLLFFVLALGLGLPFLILGIFSTAVNSIPRSGGWMVTIKKALGFVLIAMAIYFVRPLIGEQAFRWGFAISLLAGALFLLFRRETVRAANVIRFICAAILAIIGIWTLMPQGGGHMSWEKYSEAALLRASSQGKPVMIDFYADWCLPCKELDKNTFSHTGVIGEADRFVRLKGDLSKSQDPATLALTSRFRIAGVPTVVFLDSTGKEVDAVRLTGFEGPKPFLDRLKQVR